MSVVFAQGPYTLSFDLSQFEFSVENDFDRVRGIEMSATTDTGAPELPVKTLNFILPNGTRVQNIEILSLSLTPISGAYNIYPAQPLVPMPFPPYPWVPPDSIIYSQNTLYPDSISLFVTHRGSFSGIPVVTLDIYPLLYNPVKDSLYLIYTIYGGSETPSPYLVQRDGYIANENYPVDYDTTELIYKFTGLNPDLKYRLDITAYHEFGGEWREWVKIDNTAQHLIKYDGGIPKTVELPVPPASYMDDGEIVVRISKISGDFAMCHKGNLYEFEEEQEGSGPQMIMSIPMNLEFGLKVQPNILTRNTRIHYSIPTKQHITLNLYNVIGRKVATVIEGTTDPGIYITNLSAGIYFLILDGENQTKNQKILIIR
ncbi:MAG: T9SS type A sorting domain-containing protein [candidate division WOR-3 bacterium]